MHDERTPTPAEEDRRIDHAIILFLLDPKIQRPRSRDEIEREIGEDVRDSIARLHGAGLILCGQHARPSRLMRLLRSDALEEICREPSARQSDSPGENRASL
jgi:hypothetical protein